VLSCIHTIMRFTRTFDALQRSQQRQNVMTGQRLRQLENPCAHGTAAATAPPYERPQ
jgi:hypothetical protein